MNTKNAEQALLGSALIEKRATRWLLDNLTVDFFTGFSNRELFSAIEKTYKRYETVDAVLVSQDLKGDIPVKDYIDSVSTSDHVDFYGKIVMRDYYQKQMVLAARQLVSSPDRCDDLISKMTEILRARDLVEGAGFYSMKDGCHAVFDAMDSKEEDVLKTGLNSLDDITGGHSRGNLVTVGARPGVGKTAAMLSMAVNMASKYRVGYCTGEMTLSEISKRALSSHTGVSHGEMRSRNRQLDWTKMGEHAGKLGDLPLYFIDRPSPSLRDVKAFCDSARLDVIFVDYLTRCRLPDGESMRVRVNEFMRGLKNIAKDGKRLVFLGSQLNTRSQDQEDKRPTLGSLKESGAIEEESDAVILLHSSKEDLQSAGNVNLDCLVAKNRHGTCGVTKLLFEKQYMRVSG